MSMRRVSSRQRLVSWDAFEANAPVSTSGSEDSASESSLADGVLVQTGLSIKRSRSSSSSSIVPAHSWEVNCNSTGGILEDHLNGDVLEHVWSFLDLPSLRRVMQTNHRLRHAILSNTVLWQTQIAAPHWKTNHSLLPVVDQAKIPVAAAKGGPINFPLLLTWTPKNLPAELDPHPVRMLGRGGRRLSVWNAQQEELYGLDFTSDGDASSSSLRTVQYKGRVGVGDRCARANHPLPKPVAMNQDGKGQHSGWAAHLFCRGNESDVARSHLPLRPMCAPFVHKNTVHVTPRLVAYFEVSIGHASPERIESAALSRRTSTSFMASTRSDCIAVGIANEAFPLLGRMPGWDKLSFGYHGDDGGLFHASGGLVRHYGPRFGPGDTVGCGIDYLSQSIFFTLNGQHLGTAISWKDDSYVHFSVQDDWYPVIGIDSPAPVTINFGREHDFCWDLAAYLENQHHNAAIRKAFGFSAPPKDASPSRRSWTFRK